MKRLATALIALAFIAAGCGSSTSPSSTTPTKPTFTATLLPANEVPPITNAESSGTGTATITFDTTTSGGNVTAATVTFVANLTGFPAGTTVPRLGLTLAPAGQVAGSGSEGVVVTNVEPNGVAAEHGMKTGDVILEVAGKKVGSPTDIRTALGDAQKDGKRTVLLRVKSGDATKFVALPLGRA